MPTVSRSIHEDGTTDTAQETRMAGARCRDGPEVMLPRTDPDTAEGHKVTVSVTFEPNTVTTRRRVILPRSPQPAARGSRLAAPTRIAPGAQRSRSRRTNLSPDQVASMAQTLTSTRPPCSPTSRTTSSVKSVSAPDAFFGHATQSIPAGFNRCIQIGTARRKSTARVTKINPRSRAAEAGAASVAPFGSAPRSPLSPRGAPATAAWVPSLKPSFCRSGVPEYPAALFRAGVTLLRTRSAPRTSRGSRVARAKEGAA